MHRPERTWPAFAHGGGCSDAPGTAAHEGIHEAGREPGGRGTDPWGSRVRSDRFGLSRRSEGFRPSWNPPARRPD